MQNPKLVVFDVDGTLLDWDGTISSHTSAALGALRSSRTAVVVATGRPLSIGARTLEQVGGADWLVCGNGSSLLKVATGELLYDSFLPRDLIEPAIRELRTRLPGIGVAIEIGDMLLEEPGFARRVPEDSLAPPVDDALAALATMSGSVRRLNFFHDDYDNRLGELAAHIEYVADGRCGVRHFGLPIVDMSPAGEDKSTALQVLVEHLGIAAADVVAFGDGNNDIEMLQWAGTGVAMGNASSHVQAAADVVTDHIDRTGIAAYFDQHEPSL